MIYQVKGLSVIQAHNQVCIIEMRACRVEELRIAPNWSESINSKTAGPTCLLTTKSSTNSDRAGVRDIGRICLVTVVTGFSFIRGVTSASFQHLGSLCSENDAFRMPQTGEVKKSA